MLVIEGKDLIARDSSGTSGTDLLFLKIIIILLSVAVNISKLN